LGAVKVVPPLLLAPKPNFHVCLPGVKVNCSVNAIVFQ
jgi:hypothetical protein